MKFHALTSTARPLRFSCDDAHSGNKNDAEMTRAELKMNTRSVQSDPGRPINFYLRAQQNIAKENTIAADDDDDEEDEDNKSVVMRRN